jgi:Holliday junction resolvase RusA-like endonuclease
MITLKLPLEPVPAARPRFTKNFCYTPKTYREFKTLAVLLLRQRYSGQPMQGALEVCLIFSIEKPKSVKREYPNVRPDLDNFVKAIFDAANEVLWKDDAQVVDLHAFKVYGEPGITISVKNKGDIQ